MQEVYGRSKENARVHIEPTQKKPAAHAVLIEVFTPELQLPLRPGKRSLLG
jgi:hypothetical protein